MENKRNTVLFVDDEPHILAAIRRATADEEFFAIFANSGKEALQVFEEREVSVIVTDMRMPGMDGLTLLKAVREKSPQTVRIVLSGFTQLSQVLATVNIADIFQFIAKPWQTEEELLVSVRQGIARYNLEAERDALRVGLERKNQAYQKIFTQMEQRFANEKRDLTNLKRISHWIFRFLKKNIEIGEGHLEENKDVIFSHIDIIEELQFAYLDILPTSSEVKTIKTMVADITKKCAERIVINPVENEDVKLLGHHEFLIMVVKILIELISVEPKDAVVCDMKVDAKSEESYLVAFNVRNESWLLPETNQNKIKIACAFLGEMGKVYNTRILPEIKNEEASSVRVIWQTSKSNDK